MRSQYLWTKAQRRRTKAWHFSSFVAATRSPGWQGTKLILFTRDGDKIHITHTNQVWQCDHTKVDLNMVDRYEQKIRHRAWLTTVADTYSKCGDRGRKLLQRYGNNSPN
jgi:hypothetical protein